MDEYLMGSPIGCLHLKATEDALVELSFLEENINQKSKPSSGIIDRAIEQLKQYFEGDRTAFDLPLDPDGTEFQLQVWDLLKEIPFGTTTTYSRLSQKMGNPKAIRAIGKANGQNPIPIIIPCHRVIGANNNLIGYSGGIENKRWLLKHEGSLLL